MIKTLRYMLYKNIINDLGYSPEYNDHFFNYKGIYYFVHISGIRSIPKFFTLNLEVHKHRFAELSELYNHYNNYIK